MRTAPKVLVGFLSALLCLASCARSALAQDDPDLAWIDRVALDAGDVVVKTGKVAPLIVSVDVAVEIHAPREAIWQVLTACEIAPEYVPNVVDCTLVETFDEGRAQLFKQRLKPAFFIPAFDHVFRLDYVPYSRIDVSGIGGLIEYMEGTWWLLETGPDTVLLVHHLELDPGLPVPRFIVRSALRRDLPRVLAAVRDRAEGGA
jgi:hypothetical protein